MLRFKQKNCLAIQTAVLSVALIASTVYGFEKGDVRTVKTRSYADVLDLFNEIGFTAEQWQAGIREVPRIKLTHIPQRWRDQSRSLPVTDKKNLFFRLAGPGILAANENVAIERGKLLYKISNSITKHDQWLLDLAKKYKVIDEHSCTLDTGDLARLKNRVDIIPPSLALAQAAEESAWGTSRFAIQGNSFFGQWDFSGNAMAPKHPRKELGTYGVARFDTPQQSVEAYILNLNTHRAYKKLREKRAAMRKKNIRPTGWELAKTLDRYSERGADYINALHRIMRSNKLMQADEACLWNRGTIIISPAP